MFSFLAVPFILRNFKKRKQKVYLVKYSLESSQVKSNHQKMFAVRNCFKAGGKSRNSD